MIIINGVEMDDGVDEPNERGCRTPDTCKHGVKIINVCTDCLRDKFGIAPRAVCCEAMSFAIKHAIVRSINGPRFGPDVMPLALTCRIVACPWCGQPVEEKP